jgi:hypothetical protein
MHRHVPLTDGVAIVLPALVAPNVDTDEQRHHAYEPTPPALMPAVAFATCAVVTFVTLVALVALVAFATLWLAMSVMPNPLTVFGLFLMLAQLGGGALIGID